MKTKGNWFWVILLIIVFTMSACVGQSSKFINTEQSIPTNEIIKTNWASLPITSLTKDTQEDIAQKLFTIYLEQFKDETTNTSNQLVDFKIIEVTLSPFSLKCANNLGLGSIIDVQYSVEPAIYPNSNWEAGTGSSDGSSKWINGKLATLAIYKSGNSYTFKELGVPACAGVAIDGSKVP